MLFYYLLLTFALVDLGYTYIVAEVKNENKLSEQWPTPVYQERELAPLGSLYSDFQIALAHSFLKLFTNCFFQNEDSKFLKNLPIFKFKF